MAQYIQATPGSIAAAMGYSSQVPQSQYPTGQLGLAGGGIARLPYAGGTIAGGNIQGTPMGNRTGFGLFSKAKKRLKKLIPKEIAPIAMAAAPFMGPIAGPIAAGLGSYKTYGKIDPRVMAMSLAPHLRIGGGGIGYGRTDGFNIGNMGGKSLRGWLTGQGETGSGEGILKGFGKNIDARIFGNDMPGSMEGAKSGIFNTKGGPIGFEDVFETLTTGKGGEKSLKKISAIYAASATFAEAQQAAETLGIPADSLNQDEYNRVKASLTGKIPTYATGGRVGFQHGSNGGGVHDPLEQLVFLLGKRAKGTITPDESATLDALIGDTGFMSQGNAQGGLPNTRTGLQWGSDKGEGLGGEEVEADMRYEGGFMPYGEEPKADDVPARLSKDEFVFTDEAVAGAGDGDIDLGAERLYNVMKSLEQGGRLSEETQGETAQGIGELI